MKKLTSVLILLLTLLLTAGLLASCGGGGNGGGGGGGDGPLGDIVKDYSLTDVTNIRYDGETITWDAVKNAEYYLVSINGAEARKITSPLYIYSALDKAFTVKVTAKNEKNETSDELTFQPLGKVENVVVDEQGRLSWDPVTHATAYEVRMDRTGDPVIVGTTYLDIQTVGSHSYEIRPIIQGDPTYFSSFSSPKTITVLEQVDATSISYSGGYLSWRYVNGASEYEVSVNGQVLDTVKGTKLQFDPNNSDFAVMIRAIGDHVTSFDGQMSDTRRFGFLGAVTGIRVTDGILVWDEVAKATKYKLKLNGNELPNVFTTTSFSGLTEGVSTQIEILPLSDDDTVFSSWSAPVSVYLLPAPVLEWNSSYLAGNVETAAIFWNWNYSQNITGFNVKITDPSGQETVTTLPGTQRSFSNPYLQAGKYTISIQATTSEANMYSSKYSSPISVVRLDKPGNNVDKFIESTAWDLSQGFTVTFEKNYLADKYYLYKDGNKIAETTGNQFVVKGFYDEKSIDQQTFNFRIVAVGSNTLKAGTVIIDTLLENALDFNVTVLAMPQLEDMDGFDFRFTSVNGNNGYRVLAGAKPYDVNELKCDLSDLEAGGYNVSVCAKGDGRFILPSMMTPSVRVERLDAPTNIRIDTSEASEGVIHFDKVLNAQGYEIIFNNDGNPIPVDTINNINQYIKEEGTTVHMYSSANYYNNLHTVYYMTSKPGDTINFIKLKAPTFGDVAFTNDELLWNPPANVNLNTYTPAYEVYLADGTVLNGQKNGTRMDITNLEGGKSYTFMVKAIGDGKTYINSDTSVTVTIYKLATPEVKREGNAYTWKAVVDAVSYIVEIDGVVDDVELHEAGGVFTYIPKKFTELKDYQVKVYAVGDQGNTTINSDPYKITQKVAQLVTPEFTFKYDRDQYQNDGKIVVTITKESPYAYAYTYTVGSTHTGDTSADTTFSICPGSTGTYEIRVFAVGGNFDEEGTYYIDSQSQGGNSRYSITLLASPNPSDMTLSQDGKVKWTTIKGATGYNITVIKDGVPADTVKVTAPEYVIPDFEKGHQYIIEVTALGNGTTIISSELVSREWNVNG